MADTPRSTGTVKWFNEDKGFGYITPQDGSRDLFVHFTSFRSDGFRSLTSGQAVEYLVVHEDDGRGSAIDVTLATAVDVTPTTTGDVTPAA
ncbi:cold shock protein [Vigna unguiculata]|uniref:Cold shock protein n=1 Tax=Vigna unguiculata TaxID=3917 RepID=A0A4D6NU59_VIGUN|nr:cold shock protein [Vigna unguiculata]